MTTSLILPGAKIYMGLLKLILKIDT